MYGPVAACGVIKRRMTNVDRAAGRQIPPPDHAFDFLLIVLAKPHRNL